MKINSLRIFFLAILFLVNFTAFADENTGETCEGCIPGDDSGDNMLESQEVPLNSNIILLGVAGVLVGAYYFANKTNEDKVA
jgi:hypothetical protein